MSIHVKVLTQFLSLQKSLIELKGSQTLCYTKVKAFVSKSFFSSSSFLILSRVKREFVPPIYRDLSTIIGESVDDRVNLNANLNQEQRLPRFQVDVSLGGNGSTFPNERPWRNRCTGKGDENRPVTCTMPTRALLFPSFALLSRVPVIFSPIFDLYNRL